MVTKLVNQPLGMGIGDGLSGVTLGSLPHQPKLWIGAALGVAGGIASSLIGGNEAAKAARAAERRQREQEAKEEAWYNRRYNEDYIDTAAGQNLVRRAKDYAKEQWKKAAGAQAVAGGTDAATAMAKEAGNKMVGDTIANIAAADTQRKAQVDNMHRQAEAQFAQMDMAREQQRAQNITNAASAASNAMMSIGSAVDQASAKTPNLNGGSNNGVSVGDVASRMGADSAVSQLVGMEDEARKRAGLV
jgi:hypothetical protein